MTRKKKLSELHDYLFIALAMFIGSAGWVLFLLPNHITLGGLPGISSVLYWGLGIPVTVSYLVINLLLLGAALRILGWRFCIKTIWAVLTFTLATSVLQNLTGGTGLLTDQPFMATVIGGCFLGVGVGLGLSCNGSTGGSDVVAAMINKYHDISLGTGILLCDIFIVTSSYLVLKDWNQVIYGYVVLILSSICVDHVVNRLRRSVQFFIISDKYQEISRAINTTADRGCTILNGQGVYSGREVRMLFVLARQSESYTIFNLIDDIDPGAFVSQSAVIGVYGLGFDKFRRSKKSVKQKMQPVAVPAEES